MRKDLIDPEDGENRAVRAFLLHYGAPGLTVGRMRENLRLSGWGGCWPEWVNTQDREHLTKGGAQDWLRHLFALENTAGVLASDKFGDANLSKGNAGGWTADMPTSDKPDLAAHAIEELHQLGYTVRDGRLIPPDNLHELARVAGFSTAGVAPSDGAQQP
jgi:hypothetical protein